MDQLYDVVIIGGGPAGLSAAIYTARKKLKTLLITVEMGGQIVLSDIVENYPGFVSISGAEIIGLFEKQVRNFGTDIVNGKVSSVEKKGNFLSIKLASGDEFSAKAVVLAFGKVPRSLGVPSEDMFIGKGVSMCATCDAPFFRDKAVAVIGGGNSSLESAELLLKFAKKVYLIHRKENFTADELLFERVTKDKKVEVLKNTEIREIHGEKFVKSVTIENNVSGEKSKLDVDGVFINIGYETRTDWVSSIVDTNKSSEIIVNKKCETSCEGIFAAGDVTDVPYKQLVIAAGQGAVAGLSAYNYVQKLDGKTQVKADWG